MDLRVVDGECPSATTVRRQALEGPSVLRHIWATFLSTLNVDLPLRTPKEAHQRIGRERSEDVVVNRRSNTDRAKQSAPSDYRKHFPSLSLHLGPIAHSSVDRLSTPSPLTLSWLWTNWSPVDGHRISPDALSAGTVGATPPLKGRYGFLPRVRHPS